MVFSNIALKAKSVFMALVIYASIFGQNYVGDMCTEDLNVAPWLKIKFDILPFDSSGKRISDRRATYSRSINLIEAEGKNRLKVFVYNAFTKGGKIALLYSWEITADSLIKAKVIEYDPEKVQAYESGKDYTPYALKTADFVLVNLSPVIWQSAANSGKKVVIRMLPYIVEPEITKNIDSLPITGKDMFIYDNDGNIWTPPFSIIGKKIKVSTYKGTFIASYSPFDKAQAIGTVRKNKIEINVDKKIITIINMIDFIPEGLLGKVYVYYDENKRTKSRYALDIDHYDY